MSMLRIPLRDFHSSFGGPIMSYPWRASLFTELGKKLPVALWNLTAQVGVMGFSKGAYAAAIAMALEPGIPAGWLDSAPFHGLRGSFLAEEGTISFWPGEWVMWVDSVVYRHLQQIRMAFEEWLITMIQDLLFLSCSILIAGKKCVWSSREPQLSALSLQSRICLCV